MHCNQAQRRISEHEKAGTDPLKDLSLVDHFQSCSSCMQDAQAVAILAHSIEAAGEDDATDITPFHAARQRVEKQVASLGSNNRVANSDSSGLRFTWFRRSARVAYACAILAVIIIVAITPFQQNKAIGYAVAFAGVEKELAENEEIICDLLYDLGLVDANVDLLGCDSTCNVQVVELKSLAEAHLIVIAMTRINTNLKSDIITVHEDASSGLL